MKMCGEQNWGENKALFVKYYRARLELIRTVDTVYMSVGYLNG